MIGCVCVHGFTGGPYELMPLANYLKEVTDWHIEVPCLPGHGESLQLETATYKDWIKAAEEALEKVSEKCDQVYVIGFSMGGMIASYLASKYNVAKLVLLSASRKYISYRQMAMDIGMFVKEGFNGRLKQNKLFQHYMNKKGSIPIKATVEFIKCMRFTKPYLQEVTCPVLIAQGIQDGMVPYKSVYYLDKEIPADTEVIYYHDSKHLICLGDDKDVLNETVYSFLVREKGKKAAFTIEQPVAESQ
ncbi:alpha/beta fold hydrolase [Aquibacillus koreensis]|uniref:Alpha/beta fold hydrolase n=1 Tax=Aquibacillus koreensis TaxID=279446 RepID=A0A9X3WL92_9BACI|nr:alpha/beta fold hydrolase [Aquibacillus koreensis]MCT2534949.1 alpha/beta fold hydrolase [Aquibacillus koreensis]MDC3422157.1 alpha/beta fold hydrolase [Aquibacillus koreensis]